MRYCIHKVHGLCKVMGMTTLSVGASPPVDMVHLRIEARPRVRLFLPTGARRHFTRALMPRKAVRMFLAYLRNPGNPRHIPYWKGGSGATIDPWVRVLHRSLWCGTPAVRARALHALYDRFRYQGRVIASTPVKALDTALELFSMEIAHLRGARDSALLVEEEMRVALAAGYRRITHLRGLGKGGANDAMSIRAAPLPLAAKNGSRKRTKKR